MKKSEDLQKDVQEAIRWEPSLKAAEIGVIVQDGIVTLTGTVDSYAKKLQAEGAAKNVQGVRAVVEKISIKFTDGHKKDDQEIASEILRAFKWDWEIPGGKIKIKVEDGWVTLEGEVPWNYQREAAKKLVNKLSGVRGVTSSITVKAENSNAIEKRDVELALDRNWAINADDITVKVEGTKVTLIGTVDSAYQKEEAERIAWNTPGIWKVENELVVDYQYA